MKSNAKKLVTLLLSAAIFAACSSNGLVPTNTHTGSKLSDYAASWDGYAEAYTFMPSGSDRVRLTIDANGQGTLRVGDGTLFPPPTDPNVGYPPGSITGPDAGNAFQAGNNFVLGEGALYPINAPQVQTDRIQFGLKPNDYYGTWCSLQTPVATTSKLVNIGPDGGIGTGGAGGNSGGYSTYVPASPDAGDVTTTYGCLPSWGSGSGDSGNGNECYAVVTPATPSPIPFYPPDFSTQVTEPVDCGKLALCSLLQVCACTASSCINAPQLAADAAPSQYPVELDAALDPTGGTLIGTLTLPPDRVTVRLQRQ